MGDFDSRKAPPYAEIRALLAEAEQLRALAKTAGTRALSLRLCEEANERVGKADALQEQLTGKLRGLVRRFHEVAETADSFPEIRQALLRAAEDLDTIIATQEASRQQ